MLLFPPIGFQPEEVNALSWSYSTVHTTTDDVGKWSSIAIDSLGNPHISYLDFTHADLELASWTGSTWTFATPDNNNVDGHTSLALCRDNKPHISYKGEDRLKYAKKPGATWSTAIVDSGIMGWGCGAWSSIALDSNDRPHIGHVDQGSISIKYARWTGSKWKTEAIQTSGYSGYCYTSLALDSNDKPHMSWYHWYPEHLTYANKTGTSWTSTLLASGLDILGGHTSIAIDSADRPHLCYYDDSSGDLKYVRWTGTGWSSPSNVDSGGDVGEYPSLVLDCMDRAHISYYDRSNGALKYARWTGTGWSSETVDPGGDVGTYTSIAVEWDGTVHISYYDVSNTNLKYATTTITNFDTDEWFYEFGVSYTAFDCDGDGDDDSLKILMDVDSDYTGTQRVWVLAQLFDPYDDLTCFNISSWYITHAAIEYGEVTLHASSGSLMEGWYDIALYLFDNCDRLEDTWIRENEVFLYPRQFKGCDFNGDGYGDLAIGVPYEDIGTNIDAGAVNVLYGSSAGLSSTGNQLWHQNSPGILGICEQNDEFGRALACGDFDNDGYTDLAIGVGEEGIGTRVGTGAVQVLYGSSFGLSASGNQLWHQNSPGILGICEDWDQFGSALTTGDFDNDGYTDLAIGVEGEGIGSVDYTGAVQVLYGSSSGLSASGNQLWHQNSPGILDTCESMEDFGFSLIADDFNGDDYIDLAISVPGESIGTKVGVGAVQVLYGSSSGLSSSGNQLWHQNSPGILGLSEVDDWFGRALAAGDMNGDGYADLAISNSYESVGAIDNAGTVNVLYGSSSGLSASGNQLWHQNSPGILGICEHGDEFGVSVTIGDMNWDGYADIAVGVSHEDLGSIYFAGVVHVLYGSASGLSSTGNQMWHQNSPGILGICESYDYCGSALAVGDFDGGGFADLVIGSQLEDLGSNGDTGVINVIHGSMDGLTVAGNQMWHQNSPGILGICEHLDRLGYSVASK
jgi:disulfide bond formation protein DsbB